jgi:hypothetical protein
MPGARGARIGDGILSADYHRFPQIFLKRIVRLGGGEWGTIIFLTPANPILSFTFEILILIPTPYG